jgi:hypothetical protein
LFDLTNNALDAHSWIEEFSDNMDGEDIYQIGFWITWVLVFLVCWICCIADYGFLLGVGLGWMASAIVATIAAFLWPLVLIVLIWISIQLMH